MKKIFNQVVVLLAEQGVLRLRDLTLDGTKIEANANRYTFVWGKAIKVSRERIARQLGELWEYVEKVYADEEQQPNEPDNFKEINPSAVSEAIGAINEALKDKEIDPKVKQKVNYAKRNWPGWRWRWAPTPRWSRCWRSTRPRRRPCPCPSG